VRVLRHQLDAAPPGLAPRPARRDRPFDELVRPAAARARFPRAVLGAAPCFGPAGNSEMIDRMPPFRRRGPATPAPSSNVRDKPRP
jgi:hypothetical protein